MNLIAGKDLISWLRSQGKYHRYAVFYYMTPRVRQLATRFGGRQRWEAAGYNNGLEVYHSIIRELPLTVCHGVFKHVVDIIPFEEIFLVEQPDEYAVTIQHCRIVILTCSCTVKRKDFASS